MLRTIQERDAIVVEGLKRLIDEIESGRCNVISAEESLHSVEDYDHTFGFMDEILGHSTGGRKLRVIVTTPVDEYKRRTWLGIFPPGLSWYSQWDTWKEIERDRLKDEASKQEGTGNGDD